MAENSPPGTPPGATDPNGSTPDSNSSSSDNLGPSSGPPRARRSRWSRWADERAVQAVGLLAVISMITAAVISGVRQGHDQTSPTDPGAHAQLVALHTFDGCDDLLEHWRSQASQIMSPWGLEGDEPVRAIGDAAGADEATGIAPPLGAQRSAGKAASSPEGAGSQNGTNVQVVGVDEADLAKRSGDLLITVAGEGGLRVLRTTSRGTTLLAHLPLDGWTPENLLVAKDTVLVTGTLPRIAPTSQEDVRSKDSAEQPNSIDSITPGTALPSPGPTSRLAQIDLSNPGKPVLVRSLDVEGSLTGARLVNGMARVALTADPVRLRTTQPSDGTAEAQSKALETNRQIVAESGLDVWLPRYTLRGPSGTVERTGTTVGCDAVSAPGEFSGLSTLSLLSFDLTGPTGVAQWDSAAVIARGSTLYATADHTWIATSAWSPIRGSSLNRKGPFTGSDSTDLSPAAGRTLIHLFETKGRSAVKYLASGQVTGTLLNQFSLDEHEGFLRVATTSQGSSVGVPRPVLPREKTQQQTAPQSVVPTVRASVSQVTVLRRDGRKLDHVGTVGGLGHGERIRSVRFLGDEGYVVTFRQTDPLYIIDLRVPTAPRVTGELQILGYSGYLHPAGQNTLLGVGQDADLQGSTRGLQISLFDVSDPTSPRRLDRTGLSDAWSDVESDHHAFTFAGGLALVPFQSTVSMGLPAPSARIPQRTAPDEPASSGSTPSATSSGSSSSSSSSSGSSSATAQEPAPAPATATTPIAPGTAPSGAAGAVNPPFPGAQPEDLSRPSPGVLHGLFAVRTTGKGLEEPVVLHPTATGRAEDAQRADLTYRSMPLRSYLDDKTIWVLTSAGVATYDAQKLTFRGFTAF